MQLTSLFAALLAATSVVAQSAVSSAAATTTAAAVLPTSSGAPDPTINTPVGVTFCLNTQLTFSGSAPPFVITVQPGGQETAAPLETIATNVQGTSFTWLCDQPAGSSLTFVIRDNEGRLGASAPITVLQGSTTCNTTATGASTTAAGVGVTPAAATSTAPTGGTTPAANTNTVHTTTAATTTSKSGAMSLKPVGFAGVLGVLGLVAFL